MPTKAERGDMIGGDGVPMRGETRPSSHCNGMCRADIGRITRFPLGDGIELIAIGNEQNSVCDVIVGMGGSGARGCAGMRRVGRGAGGGQGGDGAGVRRHEGD